MRFYLYNLRQSLFFILSLVVISSIILITLCLNTTFYKYEVESNYLDYILPFITIIIVFYNFKYLKIKSLANHHLYLPVSKQKLFNLKYKFSIMCISFIFIVLLIISIVLMFNSKRDLQFIDVNIYILSVVIKYIVTILLFNFYLFCFLLGNKLIDSISNIVIVSICLSSLNIIILNCLGLRVEEYLDFISTPINFYISITDTFKLDIKDVITLNTVSKFIIPIFSILSITSIPLIFRYSKNHTFNNVENSSNSIIYKTSFLITTILTSYSICNLIDNYIVSLLITILVLSILYTLYSLVIKRFKPSNKELIVYLIIVIFCFVLPLLIK